MHEGGCTILHERRTSPYNAEDRETLSQQDSGAPIPRIGWRESPQSAVRVRHGAGTPHTGKLSAELCQIAQLLTAQSSSRYRRLIEDLLGVRQHVQVRQI